MYNLKVIHQILQMIDNPETRREYHGICFNLKFYYEYYAHVTPEQSNIDVAHFIKDCFTAIYGEYIPYPLEAKLSNPQRAHHRREKKWKEETAIGLERHKLRKKMCEYCEDILEKRKKLQSNN